MATKNLTYHKLAAGPLFGTTAPAKPGVSKVHEFSDAEFLPKLSELPDNALVAATQTELSQLSTVACGSVSYRCMADGLEPAIPRSNVYRAGALRTWCAKNVAATEAKLLAARHALGTPTISKPQTYVRKTSTRK